MEIFKIKEFIFLKIKNDIKVILKTVKGKVKEFFIIWMVVYIMVNGLIIKKMVMDK